MKKYIVILVTLLISFSTFAQDQKPFMLYSKVDDGKVYLKIQALETEYWYLGKEKGYLVERKNLNNDQGYKVLNDNPVLPLGAEEMEDLGNEDRYLSELKAILYDLETGVEPGRTDFNSLEEKEQEIKGRMFLHFYLSCMSETTSRASGLQYIDESADANEEYIYRVRLADNSNVSVEKEVNTFTESLFPLPELTTQGLDKTVRMNWLHKTFQDRYIAYRVEKSTDKENWQYLGESPIVYNKGVSDGPEDLDPGYIYEGDSLKENYTTYFYRLIALDFFGSQRGPGEAQAVKGRDLGVPAQPQNVKADYQEDGRVFVRWEYPQASEVPDLDGFHVGVADHPQGPFRPVNNKIVPAGERSYIHASPRVDGKNFYVVTALDTAGNYQHSLTAYTVIPDSTPPAIPVHLAGKADTNGVITIRWKMGAESDLLGYRVYRANTIDHEYLQLTSQALADTVYRDTITLKTLTKNVYYKVVAVDNNFNHSGFSEALTIDRPDIIPPVSPDIRLVSKEQNKVKIRWVPSSSRDAKESILLRNTGSEWNTVGSFNLSTNSYTDNPQLEDGTVRYALLAKDASGLYSDTSDIRAIRFIKFYQVDAVEELQASYDEEEEQVELQWEYPGDEGYFIIYRGSSNEGLKMYETASLENKGFADKRILKGNSYKYAVQVKRKDGKTSPLSENISIAIEGE